MLDSHIGLFYPTTIFQDDWIKLAALYWDRIGRLQWRNPFWQDSDVTQQLIDELGFIIDLAPSVDEISSVSNTFAEVLNECRDVLLRHYSMSQWRGIPSGGIPLKDLPSQLHLIPEEFMTSELFDAMLNARLSVPTRYSLSPQTIENGGVIEVDFTFGNSGYSAQVSSEMLFLYMRALAERVASTQYLHLVTERAFDQIASSGLSIKRLIQVTLPSDDSLPHLVGSSPSTDEIESQMAIISLRSVLPKDIASVSVRQIVKLRNQYRDELTVFQQHIHDMVLGLEYLKGIQNAKALEAHLQVEYEKKLKPQLDNLKKCLKSLGIDTAMGVLNVRTSNVPSSLASLQSQFNNPLISTIGSAITIAFNVLPFIRKKRQEAEDIISESPVGYLLYLEENIEPTQATARIVKAGQNFFHV